MKEKEPLIVRKGGNGRRSTSVLYGGTLYISGITTVDLEAETIEQAKDIFGQLDRLMKMNGTNKNNILSANIYLKTMADYGAFNSAWDLWVSDGNEPTRSVVEAKLALENYRLKVSLVVAVLK